MNLNEICGYFPYKLRGLCEKPSYKQSFEERIGIVDQWNNSGCNYELSITTGEGYYLCNLKDFKPILRPPSDLSKLCLEGHKCPIVELAFNYPLQRYQFIDGAFYCNNYGKYLEITEMPYNVIQCLFEWHFDIHGLIEKGEAIDINTIKY